MIEHPSIGSLWTTDPGKVHGIKGYKYNIESTSQNTGYKRGKLICKGEELNFFPTMG